MAENEILDLDASRWKRSREAFADPDWSLTAVSSCIRTDLTHSVQLQLSHAFREGQTLHTVLKAAGENTAALRSAVEHFRGQNLARIVRNAIHIAGRDDPARVAQCAADFLIDACIHRSMGFSGRYARFQARSQRDALRTTLRTELDACRQNLAAVLEASLRGHAVRRPQRATRRPAQATADAQTMVNQSLVVRRGSAHHAPSLF